ncbi:MAG: PorT family protein [Muribaculaceae bacterium]|nr:PorT family protein [Muribaculaceae bacterium]
MKRFLLSIIALAAFTLAGRAAEFFSTEDTPYLFNIGVRAGVNTSNRTLSNDSWGGYNFQSWGTGFNAGVVADINIKDYLAIQPGVFFESRSGHSSFVQYYFNETGDTRYVTQIAHRNSYYLNIPVLASMRFNISDYLRWHVDFGPYMGFKLKSKMKNLELISTATDIDNKVPFTANASGFDFGLKMGMGLEISRHIYFGIHYEAGMINAYGRQDLGAGFYQSYGGRTKAWTFTAGWNF